MSAAESDGGAAGLAAEFALACPAPLPPGDTILLGHGSGGRQSADLLRGIFLAAFDDPELRRLGDAAIVEADGVRLAFTTDAFVVQPPFFPGADIGSLSVHGTVNDLAMVGARPRFLAASFVLEEGLATEDLDRIARSMADACRTSSVRLVTGDTKVVERGSGDGIFVITSAIGTVPDGVDVAPERTQPGDVVLVSGPVGSHGVAVMSRRAGVSFDVDVTSDSAPLTDLVESVLAAGEVHALRDATRGGVATVLNELAAAAAVSIVVDEPTVPMLEPVRAACETLGLDPLYVANEGVFVATARADDSDTVLGALQAHPRGRDARIVGHVEEGAPAVHLRTGLGVTRPLLMLSGDQLPRIC